MAIKRTRPMAMHKNNVILALTHRPEDVALVSPGWNGTAAELIQALRDDPREWIVGGELVDDPDATTRGVSPMEPVEDDNVPDDLSGICDYCGSDGECGPDCPGFDLDEDE